MRYTTVDRTNFVKPCGFPLRPAHAPAPVITPVPAPVSSRVPAVRLTLVRGGCALLLWLLIGAMPVVHAQGSGLKLGEENPAEPTLDLGAAPSTPAATATPAAPSTPTEPPAPGAGTGEVSRTTYADWEVACTADGNNCAMAQIGKDNTGTPVLEMVLRKLDKPLEADGRTAVAVLDIITPLGVVLTEGLGLTIDNGQEELAPFQICTEQGCLVREPIDDDLVSRLKKGNRASVRVVAASQGEVRATISLSGFTKAYNAL